MTPRPTHLRFLHVPRSLAHRLVLLLVPALTVAGLLAGCDAGDSGMEEPRAEEIGAYLQALEYSPEDLLNVQAVGAGNAARVPIDADTTTSSENDGTTTETCIRTTYNLRQNVEDIAILRPTADVIWPGALVKGNGSLMDGLPEPVRLSRSPVSIRIDLPGIGRAGTRTIDAPSLGSVQAEIDDALEWWNANAYRDGYRNANNSYSRVVTSYRSTQAAMDLGMNVGWATGSVRTHFGYETNATRRIVMALHKQAFYTVSFFQEPGAQPEDVFGPDVTLNDIERVFDASAPPAYIASVTYGRILMFRMETSASYTAAEAEAAFRYASGVTSGGADVHARYEEILSNSEVEIVTIGGNPDDDLEVSELGAGTLQGIIESDGVYARDNPGVPIAYAVKYLRDDALARLGYTTEYTATECRREQTADRVQVSLDRFKVIEDCDEGLFDGPGDFFFEASVYNGRSRVAVQKPGWLNLGDGDDWVIDQAIVFTAPRQVGASFRVEFRGKEKDPGDGNYDSRMNNDTGSVRHEFDGANWTDLLILKKIPIGSGSGCKAELWYTAEVL